MQHNQRNSGASCSQDCFPGSYSSTSRSHREAYESWPTGSVHMILGLPVHQENPLAVTEDYESSILDELSVFDRSMPLFQTSSIVFETSPPAFESFTSQEELEGPATLPKSPSSWPASSSPDTCSNDGFVSDIPITDTSTNLPPAPATVPTQGIVPDKPSSFPSDFIRCWQHGCGGRSFSNVSNYRRHCKEKSGQHSKASCPRCGRKFSRTAARDLHMGQERCQITLLDANGIPFRTKMTLALPAELVATGIFW